MSISTDKYGEGNTRVDVADLDKAIAKILNEFGEEITYILQETTEYVAKKGKDVVKENAPVGPRKGKYKKSISVKKLKSDELESHYVIYSKKEYPLTHLLEHGHATADGTGRTKAQPHFAKGEKWILDNYEKEFLRRFNNGRK